MPAIISALPPRTSPSDRLSTAPSSTTLGEPGTCSTDRPSMDTPEGTAGRGEFGTIVLGVANAVGSKTMLLEKVDSVARLMACRRLSWPSPGLSDHVLTTRGL